VPQHGVAGIARRSTASLDGKPDAQTDDLSGGDTSDLSLRACDTAVVAMPRLHVNLWGNAKRDSQSKRVAYHATSAIPLDPCKPRVIKHDIAHSASPTRDSGTVRGKVGTFQFR
jgi:hypothetical protein